MDDLIQLSESLNLGSVSEKPDPVSGGLLHKMWRLRTNQDQFAVKELDPGVVGSPQIRDEYRVADRISNEFFSKGVPAICAREFDGETLHGVNGKWFQVFQWVSGACADPSRPTVEQAQKMGEVLGNIHALNIDLGRKPESGDELSIENHQFASLIEEGISKNSPWASALLGKDKHFVEIEAKANRYFAGLVNPYRMSHGDMDQKNVLWNDAGPHVIDWEGAGYLIAEVEVLDLALHWSGLNSGVLDWEVFGAFLSEYRKVSKVTAAIAPEAIFGCMHNWLGWMEANIHRSLGHTPRQFGSAEAQSKEIIDTVHKIELIETMLPRLSKEIRQA